MTDFTRHTVESAPEAAKPLLEGAQKSVGFIPNLYATMAEAPTLLETYLTVGKILSKTSLNETERQIVMMTNNRINGCEYCMAAHTTLSQGSGVPADVIEALRKGTAIADPKLEALRAFAATVNESRGWPKETDLQALFDAGYTKQTVLEVVLLTGFKVLSNYTNHVAETPVDAPFAANAWTADQAVAAE
ncbi:MAG: carboxymuconolactone decarboxylase family protein [Pseudomonadota bacterium]